MKLYIATLIKHDYYDITAITFVDDSAEDVAFRVCGQLDEEDFPYDPYDIMAECENGNQHGSGEPFSIGADTDLSREFLLSTKIEEV